MSERRTKKPNTKCETSSDSKANTLFVAGLEENPEKALAKTALRPSVRAGLTIKQWSKKFGELGLSQLVDELQAQSDVATTGDLARGEAMLTAQAHTLDVLFNELLRRAAAAETMPQLETYARLGFKAQSQCRTTIETLAEIKNPRPVAFVKQANIANNQQVNNGPQSPGELVDQYAQAHAGAREIQNQPNELLEVQHGKRLDTGTAGQTIGGDKTMEAVGAVNGATV